MKPIEIEFENELQFDDIVKLLVSPTGEQTPDGAYIPDTMYNQTVVDGVVAPIIRLNNITIDISQIVKFRLWCDVTPRVTVTIYDTYSISRVLDSPKSDNSMMVQILPSGDGIYKKIQLPFYITDYVVRGDKLTINAIYNVSGMFNFTFNVFGKMTTCNLAREVAKQLKLGYATNINDVQDSRYMYARGKTMMDTLAYEMQYSGDSEHILDYWVDYWNNLTVVDILDAYKNNDDDIRIHIDPLSINAYNDRDSMDMIEVEATLTNHPMINTSLRYDTYRLILDTSDNVHRGTDKMIESYSVDNQSTQQTEVSDGDVNNDIFRRYEYCGEFFGDNDYVSQSMIRNAFMQKMNSKKIQIELSKVQFGLMRGTRVNVSHYECDDTVTKVMNESKITKNNNVSDDTGEAQDFVMNKTISGQYLITDTEIVYKASDGLKTWRYILTLVREEGTVENYIEEKN